MSSGRQNINARGGIPASRDLPAEAYCISMMISCQSLVVAME